MNETIRVLLQCDGKNLTVDSLNTDGITLTGESSASPRGCRLAVMPATPATEFRWSRVRQIQDWQPGEFRLKLHADGEGLVLSGFDQDSLPEGRYTLRLEVADMLPFEQPVAVDVPFRGEAKVIARFKSDRRRFQLVTAVKNFDPKILAVVEASTVDGESAAAWLQSANPRARRKACFLNILAKLRAAKGVEPKIHLISSLNSVFFADVDRIYADIDPALSGQFETLAADPAKPFFREGKPKAKVHERLVASRGGLKAFQLTSYRQEGGPSLQAVVATPKKGAGSLAEFDIDLGNPLQDLAGAVVHIGELLNPGKTDHLALAEKLSRGPSGDFSYYKVIK